MSFDSIDTILQPGLRHWREYQEYQRAHVAVIPALDKGPRSGRVHIDPRTRQVIIDPEPPTETEPD